MDTHTVNIEFCSFSPDMSVFSATIARSGQKSHNGNTEEESTETDNKEGETGCREAVSQT